MTAISTRDLSNLPSVDILKKLLQSMATLDAIMSMDDGDAYFYFQSKWGKSQQMGSMTDGSGDEFFAYFNRHGCFLKGFAHESTMSPYQFEPPRVWPGVLDGVPAVFNSALNEPAFSMADTTFAIWRLNHQESWQRGEIEYPDNLYGDGSEELLSILDGQAESYVEWATEYYEVDVEVEPVQHIYSQLPLCDDILKSLNPEASLGKLNNCLVQIGYPGMFAG